MRKKRKLKIWMVHIRDDGWWADLRGFQEETRTDISVSAETEADAITKVQRLLTEAGLDIIWSRHLSS